jgi:hypothetical protein
VSLPVRYIVRSKLKISMGTDGGNVVRVEGVMRDEEGGGWFSLVLAEIHDEALKATLPEVVLDICRLDYASAALWKCLAAWIRRVDEAEGAYALRLRVSPQGWQQIGAEALAGIADHKLIIEHSDPSSTPHTGR